VLDPLIIKFYSYVFYLFSLKDLAGSLIGTYVLVATAVVIVLSILAYQEWRDRKEKKEAVVDVYSAESLDKLAKLLSQAEEEIELVGITLQELQHTMTTLEHLLKKKGFRVKILLVDPNNMELMPPHK
jgi:membrane protein implicated in regulation of membrane protease activity